jgi:hypothetical protein
VGHALADLKTSPQSGQYVMLNDGGKQGGQSREGMGSGLAVRRKRDVTVLVGPVVPALVAASGTDAAMRFLDFFATQIENDNTRAANLY